MNPHYLLVVSPLRKLKAVILAAGEGKRLRPLTLTRPKAMLPVGGKPILEHLVTNLKGCGIRDMILVVGYHEDLVMRHFTDGSPFGVKIEYVHQKKRKGTASALNKTRDSVGDAPFLVVYGDLMINRSAIESMLEKAEERADAVLSSVPVENPESYGVFKMRGDRVECIVEKPSREGAPSNLANAGVYILSPGVFRTIEKVGPSSRGELELTDAITLLIKEGGKTVAVRLSQEEWMDVGYPWDLLRANERILSETAMNVEGEVSEGATLRGKVGVAKGAEILPGAYIEGPVLIGEGCKIGPNCHLRPNTCLGRGVKIGNACEVKNSIVMDGSKVAHLSYLADSIVGCNCNFGAGTIVANLRFDDGSVKMTVEDKRIDSSLRKLGVVIGDNVKTGINVSLMPGVKVGPNSWIGPSATIFDDVPPSTYVEARPPTKISPKGEVG